MVVRISILKEVEKINAKFPLKPLYLRQKSNKTAHGRDSNSGTYEHDRCFFSPRAGFVKFETDETNPDLLGRVP